MKDAGLKERVVGRVAVSEDDSTGIGYWKRLGKLSGVVTFREVIFCEGVLSFRDIIDTLPELPRGTMMKFHATGSHSIVGSDSKDSSGEFVSKENGLKISLPHNRRLKRLIDVGVSVAGLVTFPLQLFIVKKPFRFFANCIAVVFAQKTWIGYATLEKNLPPFRRGVMTCNGLPASTHQALPSESLQMVDYWYARDYEPSIDLRLVGKAYRN